MTGESATTVVVRSGRSEFDDRCQQLVREVTHFGVCPVYFPITVSLSNARRVYRPAAAPPPPSGAGEPLVMASEDSKSFCDI